MLSNGTNFNGMVWYSRVYDLEQGHDNIQRQITRLIVSRIMIYPMVPFPVTLSGMSTLKVTGNGTITVNLDFKVTGLS